MLHWMRLCGALLCNPKRLRILIVWGVFGLLVWLCLWQTLHLLRESPSTEEVNPSAQESSPSENKTVLYCLSYADGRTLT